MHTNTTHTIEFGPKFCQAQLESVFHDEDIVTDSSGKEYIEVINHWEKSFSKEITFIIFDLTITEWINTEEIVFLFTWIRQLLLKRKKVSINLPYGYDLRMNKAYYNEEKQKTLYNKFSFKESKHRISRRYNRNISLMVNWGLRNRIGIKDEQLANTLSHSVYNKRYDLINLYFNKVVPFSALDASFDGNLLSFDNHFKEVLEGNRYHLGFGRMFSIEDQIANILNDYGCYSPFESKILSNVIFQELYLNSTQHSFKQEESTRECYTAASFIGKKDTPLSKSLIIDFISEIDSKALDFYKDKNVIKKLIEKELELISAKDNKKVINRKAKLDQFNEIKNQSFIEYTFMDLGQGIPLTLEKQFDAEIGNERLKQYLSNDFGSANKHSQIIEFAFLLETSCIPLDRNIENYKLIPRGLYFLIDMVRRYKGLIKIHSREGKVIFDFSDKLYIENVDGNNKVFLRSTFPVKEAVIHDNVKIKDFPGTLISIVLPEKIGLRDKDIDAEEIDSKRAKEISPIRLENSILNKYIYYINEGKKQSDELPYDTLIPKSYHYVSLTLLLNEVINLYIKETSMKKDDTDQIKTNNLNSLFYNLFYSRFVNELNNYSGTNCVIFLDFTSLFLSSQVMKILYYILTTPKINELTKIVLINLDTTNSDIVSHLNVTMVDEHYAPYFYKPIPIIDVSNIHNDPIVSWIGLRDAEDASLLTKILLNDYSVWKSAFKSPLNTEGNMFFEHGERVYSFFRSIEQFESILNLEKKKTLLKYLENQIVDGRIPNKKGEKHVFLATNGSYQYEYLALYEELNNKYIARFFARNFLDQLLLKIRLKKNEILQSHLSIEDKMISIECLYESIRFEKIITVTVSSQLLGIAMRDLIKEDDCYKDLKINGVQEDTLESAPKLLILSSYYSFDTEAPFSKIYEGDKIAIVNDVISTGSLMMKLINKIEKEKYAVIQAIFSIADTRITDGNITNEEEAKSFFTGEYEKKFISISTFSDGLEIRKYKRPYRGTSIPHRINPLLNSVVELKATHSESSKILFEEPSDLIKSPIFKETMFRVGHFIQNLTHNGYITDMHPIFFSNKENDPGYQLLLNLNDKLNDRINVSMNFNRVLSNFSINLNLMKRLVTNPNSSNSINQIETLFEEFMEVETSSHKLHKFIPDYIFYPVFSGIEQLRHSYLSKIFGTHIDNIIAIQRFDTNKGWRFPFLAKRYNELTKDKSILILDSGALTGESLIQLMDLIAFQDVKEIIILDIICRIEDFSRELYSRLKSIKVKQHQTKDNTNQHSENNNEHVVPISIIFGTNLHVPVYSNHAACPFCKEIEELKQIKTSPKIDTASKWTKSYIEHRESELLPIDLGLQDKYIPPKYLPLKTNKEIDSIEILLMRDKVGKIESYRFYKEYFQFFDELTKNNSLEDIINNKDILKQFELILTIIIHEPKLLETISDLLIDTKELCEQIIELVISKKMKISSFNYSWSEYSWIRLRSIFLKDKLYNIEEFEKLFEFSLNDDLSLSYLSFLLWKGFFKIEDDRLLESVCADILIHMAKEFDNKITSQDKSIYKNFKVQDIVKDITEHLKNTDIHDINTAYYNLLKFFISKSSDNHHDFLTRKISIISARILNKEHKIEHLKDILQSSKDIIMFVKKTIYDNLTPIKNSKEIINLHKVDYNNLFDEKNSVYADFEKLYKRFFDLQNDFQKEISITNIKIELTSLIQDIRRYQTKYLLNDRSKPFVNYVYKFRCNLRECIVNAISSNWVNEMLKRENKSVSFNFDKVDNININAHEELLTNAFIELFVNAVKYTIGDIPNLTIRTLIIEKSQIATLSINQSSEFIESTGHERGLPREIMPIFKIFCQSENGIRITKKPSYNIELDFNLHLPDNF